MRPSVSSSVATTSVAAPYQGSHHELNLCDPGCEEEEGEGEGGTPDGTNETHDCEGGTNRALVSHEASVGRAGPIGGIGCALAVIDRGGLSNTGGVGRGKKRCGSEGDTGERINYQVGMCTGRCLNRSRPS